MSKNPIFETEEFKELENYVLQCWKPNSEAYVLISDKSQMYNWLCSWFSFIDIPNNEENTPTINIGPYVGVMPYGKFKSSTIDSDGNVYEFVFIYDSVDNTKLTKMQLSLGRSDFIDIFHPKIRNDL